MTGTNETTPTPEPSGDAVRCWYCDKWMAASLASCPHCATVRLTTDDWHGKVNAIVETVNAPALDVRGFWERERTAEPAPAAAAASEPPAPPTVQQVLDQLGERVARMQAAAKPTTQWLYRVLATDDDGDPIDFGVVHAATEQEAHEQVAAHLTALEAAGWDGGVVEVRFYPVKGIDARGIVQTGDYNDVCLELPASDDEAGR